MKLKVPSMISILFILFRLFGAKLTLRLPTTHRDCFLLNDLSLSQLREASLKCRYWYGLLMQERQKIVHGLRIDQVFRVPDRDDRSEHGRLLAILLQNRFHHGSQLVESHAAEVELAWIVEPHEIRRTVQPSTAALNGPAETVTKAQAFRRRHLPGWHHIRVDRHLDPRTMWLSLVDVAVERPVIAVPSCPSIIEPMV